MPSDQHQTTDLRDDARDAEELRQIDREIADLRRQIVGLERCAAAIRKRRQRREAQ